MALACEVISNTTRAGGTPLEALAAVHAFFRSDGFNDWCYAWGWDPSWRLVPGAGSWGYNSYSYQCCTQGTVYSSMLPAQRSAGTLVAEDMPVMVQDVESSCRWVGRTGTEGASRVGLSAGERHCQWQDSVVELGGARCLLTACEAYTEV